VIEQQGGDVRYLQFSLFRQFPALIHGIFTRLGGYSEAPYHSLNVSFKSDNPDHVLRNRLLALKTLGIQHYPCATVWQIHSIDVTTLGPEPWEDWLPDWPYRTYHVKQDGMSLQWTGKPRRKADAIITRQCGVTLALSFADCVPILFYDPARSVIGIAHAGWRGTARGMMLAMVDVLRKQFGCRLEDLYVGIAPSIGPCCYEVTEHVQQIFQGQAGIHIHVPQAGPIAATDSIEWVPPQYKEMVRESAVFSLKSLPDRESLRLDLWRTNHHQLLMAGLRPEHIESSEICTSCHTDLFFSHRAEHGQTGRFPVLLALKDTK
jgi:YfiH family protein